MVNWVGFSYMCIVCLVLNNCMWLMLLIWCSFLMMLCVMKLFSVVLLMLVLGECRLISIRKLELVVFMNRLFWCMLCGSCGLIVLIWFCMFICVSFGLVLGLKVVVIDVLLDVFIDDLKYSRCLILDSLCLIRLIIVLFSVCGLVFG